MGRIEPSRPVKLFVGLITSDIGLIEKVRIKLSGRFGPTDCQSELMDFNFTDYYSKEMGEGLKRKFFSFRNLFSVEHIGALKSWTNKLENRFSLNGRRRINIDPGYLTPSKLVLLTTKDFYHRIYLGRGIYAEVTLFYKDKAFRPFEWTYPDYKSRDYIDFFNTMREGYMKP